MVFVDMNFSFTRNGGLMMRLIYLWCFISLGSGTVLAQIGIANSLSAAEALYAKKPTIWGLAAYPASLATQKEEQAGVFGEKRYLSDLNFFQLGFSAGLFKQHFLISLIREGTNAFSQNSIVLSAGKKINSILGIGLSIGYTGYYARGYPSKGTMSAGLGAILQLNEQIRFGVQLNQLNALISENEEFPFVIRAGMGFRFSPLCSISIEAIKEAGKEMTIDAGIQYIFHGNAYARLGYNPSFMIFSCSLGYTMKKLSAELGPAYHLSLGATWGLSLVYHFKDIE
jgi:F0F1-type ATP synthase membrane subunit c/vacuolar-type H+-ATPase subunit K